MGQGYSRRRTHRQQIRYERRVFWVLTFLGLALAAGVAAMALMK
jgi:hypothetical protein